MALIRRPSAYSAGRVSSASPVRTVTASPFTTTSAAPGSLSSSAGSGAGVLKRRVLVAVNALIWAWPAATAADAGPPRIRTSPEVGVRSPGMVSIAVDLPAPFGPSSATVSPGCMSKQT